jgi:hypothetical protein
LSSAEAPPGLNALILYLRPTSRARLLGTLADMGIFVMERQGAPLAPALAPVDLCLVVADEKDGPIVRELARTFPTLVVCLPPGARSEAFDELGVLCCIGDAGAGEHAILRQAALRARTLRGTGRPAPTRVFGDVDFQLVPPALQRGDRSLPLSTSERELLRMLAGSIGRAVSLAELERAAAVGPTVHPGFLKAVVLRLRRKVEELGGDAELLRTIRGFGYILVG